jgi:hypothetical protein
MPPIPLRDRDGRLITVAVVDESDYDRINRHRWSLMGGVARRGVQIAGRHRSILMHREVVGATFGDGLAVEHVNGNKLDNRRGNLRVRPAASAGPLTRAPAPGEATWRPDMLEAVR